MFSGLINLPLNFHLFFFRHALFGCEMLKVVLIISGSSLRRPLTCILLLREILDWLHNWSILDVNSIWPTNGHATRINEFDHLLADNRHLKDLGDRWPFLGAFIKKGTNQVLKLFAIAGRNGVVFILDNLINKAEQIICREGML